MTLKDMKQQLRRDLLGGLDDQHQLRHIVMHDLKDSPDLLGDGPFSRQVTQAIEHAAHENRLISCAASRRGCA
jgi:hypothetical protein